MNSYSWWKNLLIASVVVMGGIYAMPNLYRPDPAIQISGEDSGQILGEEIASTVSNLFKDSNIAVSRLEQDKGRLLYRLRSDEDQLRARILAQEKLGGGLYPPGKKTKQKPVCLF